MEDKYPVVVPIEGHPLKVLDTCYHRNGVGGIPFTAVRMLYRGKEYLATLFPTAQYIAVYGWDQRGKLEWEVPLRGDRFEVALRAVLSEPAHTPPQLRSRDTGVPNLAALEERIDALASGFGHHAQELTILKQEFGQYANGMNKEMIRQDERLKTLEGFAGIFDLDPNAPLRFSEEEVALLDDHADSVIASFEYKGQPPENQSAEWREGKKLKHLAEKLTLLREEHLQRLRDSEDMEQL